jgi:hypothetical protein
VSAGGCCEVVGLMMMWMLLLMATCRGRPRRGGGGTRRLRNEVSPARRLSWFCVRRCPGRLEVERRYLVSSLTYLQEKEVCLLL